MPLSIIDIQLPQTQNNYTFDEIFRITFTAP